MEILMLIISLIVILIAAELFVNSIEWLGKLLNLSEGAVGSVLAAVGTALPETLIPIIALLSGNTESAKEIGIGAILGAPLMLSTLTMFVTGCAVIAYKHKRKHKDKVVVHYNTVSRDLKFFIFSFVLALLCGFIHSELRNIKVWIGALLVLAYFIYIIKIVKENRENDSDVPDLYFTFGNNDIMKSKYAVVLVLIQAAIALTLIIVGAEKFVDSISYISNLFKIPAFVLAIIITPIATELPEKFNSVIWISREKDTLALGNITGAMMFQASILPAIGILLTDWTLTSLGTIISSVIAITSAALLLYELNLKKHMTVKMLLTCGMFYFLFIVLVCIGIIR
ncbi:MAG: sodium:calcium antiporter [Bacilli bacterium]|nr:sodium:calcium antiporter [Bacilli bacterium]